MFDMLALYGLAKGDGVFHEFEQFDSFDETANAVVDDLHQAQATKNAGDIALMKALVKCDQKRVYRRDEAFDIARWGSIELGVSYWEANRFVQAGYALKKLKLLPAAYRRGELSTSKFLELARFATPDTEAALLPWATRTTPAGIRARADREIRAQEEEIRDADKWRSLKWEWDEGHTRLDGWFSLPADHGAKFVKAVDRMAKKMVVSPEDDPDLENNIESRRADALVAMASASIANDQSPDKATLVVHTTVNGILDRDQNGILAGGLPIPPNAADLVGCDSRVQTVLHDESGDIFHIASPSYVVPKWLRRQVEHRDDYRCTFPNCDVKAFTDVHHIVPWPRGLTELSNLTLLCSTHHRLIHIYGWHVRMKEDGTTEWFRPDWTPYAPRAGPAKARLGSEEHSAADVEKDA